VAFSELDGSFTFEDFPMGTWDALVVEQLGYHTVEGAIVSSEGLAATASVGSPAAAAPGRRLDLPRLLCTSMRPWLPKAGFSSMP